MLDTGISTSGSDKARNRITAFKDFVNQKDGPYDDNGHGTFVAGKWLPVTDIHQAVNTQVLPEANQLR